MENVLGSEGEYTPNPLIEEFLANLGEGARPEDQTLLTGGRPYDIWMDGKNHTPEELRRIEDLFLGAEKRRIADILKSDLPWVMETVESILEEISANAMTRQFRGPGLPDLHTRKVADDCLRVIRGEVSRKEDDPEDINTKLALSLVARYLHPLTLRFLDSDGKDNSFRSIINHQVSPSHNKENAIRVYESLTQMFDFPKNIVDKPLTFWAKKADPEYYVRKEYESIFYG